MSRIERVVTFDATTDPHHPYAAVVDGERWRVRVNEVPHPKYSLLIDDRVVADLPGWPPAWIRPTDARDDDPGQRAEYEREREQFERTKHIKPYKPTS